MFPSSGQKCLALGGCVLIASLSLSTASAGFILPSIGSSGGGGAGGPPGRGAGFPSQTPIDGEYTPSLASTQPPNSHGLSVNLTDGVITAPLGPNKLTGATISDLTATSSKLLGFTTISLENASNVTRVTINGPLDIHSIPLYTIVYSLGPPSLSFSGATIESDVTLVSMTNVPSGVVPPNPGLLTIIFEPDSGGATVNFDPSYPPDYNGPVIFMIDPVPEPASVVHLTWLATRRSRVDMAPAASSRAGLRPSLAGFPERDGAAAAAADQTVAPIGPGDAPDVVAVRHERIQLAAGRRLPELGLAAGAGQCPAVRTERQRTHRPRMSAQHGPHRVRGEIPQANRAVFVAARQRASVRREGHPVDDALLPVQVPPDDPSRRIPELDGEIGRRDGKHLAVGTVGQSANKARVSVELGGSLTRVQVPDANGSVQTARSERPAVRAEGDLGHTGGVSFQAGDFLPAVAVPDVDDVIQASHGEILAVRGDRQSAGWHGDRSAGRPTGGPPAPTA